ncbi:GAF domain-containing protein [Leptolyngbya cf. ectocarpi LEGE 11479]|uniref:histidine kinase n=1 Tax=Leptolyngbya cf. ectocarpi LEGE 11479 TaxID=1828722 RepID=A0A928ZTT2_LEPEC|nr:ATP-binding protein [Leptolyngbya ectocarpi]MBE9067109.1 GAF domain-containing protein [Leptolyngbya cf. ectocarpi LEGE 11479]
MRQSDFLHNAGISAGRLQQNHDFFPVHLIGLTQPHGVLLALEGENFTITQVSDNTTTHLGITPQSLLGQPLLELLGSTTYPKPLHHYLETCTEHASYVQVSICTPNGSKDFDGLVHRGKGSIVLELEPIGSQTSLQTAAGLMSLQTMVQQAIRRLRSIDDATEFLQAAVTEIQALTGYDRVMVYQFDEDQAGSVVAEVKPSGDVAYLGLHYPATDIPALVRQLYQRGLRRYIPDLTAAPVALVNAADASKTPLDLSYAILRGVDPCCIDYHQNMNVTGLMVIALVRDNQLWGLLACHHRSAKFLPYSVRSACEVLAQLIAAELASKVDKTELSYLNHLQTIQTDFVASIATAENFKQALIHPEPRLLDMVNAQGAAVCLDQDITLIGQTPPLDIVQDLISWSMEELSTELFHTNCLLQDYPAIADFKAVASGLVVLKISQLRRYLILWFRPEVLQIINWAGNPNESIHGADADNIVLCPRTSFRQWQETVRATALPWQPVELTNAIALKNAIVGIVLNKADELAQINRELERSNRELDSFAYAASHDLKEPLRGITNFSNILLKRHSHDLDQVAVKRLKTLVKLAERMDGLIDALLRFSRLSQDKLQYQATDLNVLVSSLIEDLSTTRSEEQLPLQIVIPKPLPVVSADPDLVREVFSNLLSNALKYTHAPQPKIEVGYLTADERPREDRVNSPDTCILYVKDDGIGIHERHFQNIFRLFKRLHERDCYGGGTGVGLTIAMKIIERHGGRIWVESKQNEGTTFYFVLSHYKQAQAVVP